MDIMKREEGWWLRAEVADRNAAAGKDGLRNKHEASDGRHELRGKDVGKERRAVARAIGNGQMMGACREETTSERGLLIYGHTRTLPLRKHGYF